MKLRTTAAAIGAGVVLAASVPGVAQAVDPQYPPTITPVTCSAYSNSSKSKITVNVGPNLPGNGSYSVRIQKKVKGGWVQYSKVYQTKGSNETRTINVKKGTWRFKCYSLAFPVASPSFDSFSNPVKIRK